MTKREQLKNLLIRLARESVEADKELLLEALDLLEIYNAHTYLDTYWKGTKETGYSEKKVLEANHEYLKEREIQVLEDLTYDK